MTAVGRRPRRRKAVIGAVLLAPLALLGARRAMQAGAVRRSESRRGLITPGRDATAGATAASVARAIGPPLETSAGSLEPTRPAEPSAADRRKRKRRAPRLVLAAASVAVIGAFIQHARSQVPRPTLVLERPTSVSPATQARTGPHGVPNSPAAKVRSTPSGVSEPAPAPAPASAAPAPRRSGTRASHQTLRQRHSKHQSNAGQSSGRRPAQPPVVPAKHAREKPVPPAVVGGQALHRLRWNAVAGATYYNLVLWRDGKRVLDLWPTSPRVVVPSTSIKHGTQARLSPGRYLWFVYPGFGAKPAHQYGALAGSGVLVVQPKGGNEG
jgi:hypothetical protein